MSKAKFFVGLKNPVQVRRSLLTSSRNLISALIMHEEYKGLREEKRMEIISLKKSLDTVAFLNRKMRAHLPQMELPKGMKKRKSTLSIHSSPSRRSITAPQSRLDKLKEELASFEEKLSEIR
jgi:hypothetical protein